MIAPGVHHGLHVPRALPQIVFAITAALVGVLAWGALTIRHTANRADYALVSPINPSAIHWVAYSVPESGFDTIYLRDLAPEARPRVVAAFPYSFSRLHARGSSSPTGSRLAVLHVETASGSYARLALVAIPSGEVAPVPGEFDYLSTTAWSPDGSRLAVVRSGPPNEAGHVRASVLEVDTATASVSESASFDGVFQAAPAGYSLDGERLFVVVVDQSGSALWSTRRGRTQKVATLGPGRTFSWALSPDGSQLAYVESLGAGERSYAGRTLVVATGRINDTPSFDDQLGTAWRPGWETPVFGGPGGSVRLSSEAREAAYVVPQRWSPDGSTLVATVYPAGGDRGVESAERIELVSPEHRVWLSDVPGAVFLGFVRDVE